MDSKNSQWKVISKEETGLKAIRVYIENSTGNFTNRIEKS